MRKEDRERFERKELSTSFIIACLSTCEEIIGKNAYLEKKWANSHQESVGHLYSGKRKEWMDYREKLRAVLKTDYSMKEIIQMTKGSTVKSAHYDVPEVVDLIDKGDYVLVSDR